MKALHALGMATEADGVPARTRELRHLRASQINGCSVCVDMHPRLAKQHGETDQRLFAVGAWRDAPFFSNAERAALASPNRSHASATAQTGAGRCMGRSR